MDYLEKRAHSIKGILVIQTKYSCFLCERVNELVTWRAGIHGGRRLKEEPWNELNLQREERVYGILGCLVFAFFPFLWSTCEFVMICTCTFFYQKQRLALRNDHKHHNKRLAWLLTATLITQHLDLNRPQGSFDLKECNFNIYIMNKKAKREIQEKILIEYCVNSADRAGADKSPK